MDEVEHLRAKVRTLESENNNLHIRCALLQVISNETKEKMKKITELMESIKSRADEFIE